MKQIPKPLFTRQPGQFRPWFRFWLSALLLFCVTIGPVDAAEPIGHLVVAAGKLIAVGADGTERRLSRRDPVYSGDTLKTSGNVFAQVRFKDGALIALRPKTELKIEEYAFSGQEDGSEKAFFKLVKGGFRTITGAIGHKNKQNYSVTTPVATSGIRGTHYGLRVLTPQQAQQAQQGGNSVNPGLYGGVVDGEIAVENGAGESTFGNDRYFYVADTNSEPETLIAPPGIVFDVDRRTDQEGDEEETAGERQGTDDQDAGGEGEGGEQNDDQGNQDGDGQQGEDQQGDGEQQTDDQGEGDQQSGEGQGDREQNTDQQEGGEQQGTGDQQAGDGQGTGDQQRGDQQGGADQQRAGERQSADQQVGTAQPTPTSTDNDTGANEELGSFETTAGADSGSGEAAANLGSANLINPDSVGTSNTTTLEVEAEPVFESNDEFNAGSDAQTATSASVITNNYTRLATGSRALVAFVTFDSANNQFNNTSAHIKDDGTSDNQLLINADGRLVEVSELDTDGPNVGKTHTFDFADATLQQSGSAHNLSWGRWSSGYSVTTDSATDEPRGPLHYVYTQNPASYAQVSSHFANSAEKRLVFDFADNLGTKPTDQDGNVGSYEYAQLVLNMNSGKVDRYDLKTVVGSLIFTMDIGNNTPSIADVIDNKDRISLTGDCSGGCTSSSAQGEAGFVFADTNGDYIGSTFSLRDNDNSRATTGSIVFERTATKSNPQTISGSSTAYVAFIGAPGSSANTNKTEIIAAGNELIDNSDTNPSNHSTTTSADSDARFVSYNGIGNVITEAAEGTGTARNTFDSGRGDLVDTGGDSVGVNWGRWTDGWNTNLNGSGVAPLGHAHFIHSDKVTADAELKNMVSVLGGTSTATATFNHIGGTSPTDNLGNVGTLNSASAQVTFDGTVSGIFVDQYKVNFTVNGHTFDMAQSTAIGFSDARQGNITLQDNNDTNIQGAASLQLIGTNASHAISGYSANGNGTQAVGTLLLKR